MEGRLWGHVAGESVDDARARRGSLARSRARCSLRWSAPAQRRRASSLPAQKGTATRPGPAVLYQPLAQAPQLENATGSGWHAKPILISGASAYRHGEFLYQGYVYDDHGAKEALDPTNPMISPGGDASGGDTFSEPTGTYTYPTGPGYDENAANLVELRVRAEGRSDGVPDHAQHAGEPRPGRRRRSRSAATKANAHPFPFGANVERAGAVLPHGARRNGDAHRRGERRRSARPAAERERRPRAPPDHGRSAAQRVEPGHARRFGSRPASACGTRATASYLLPGAVASATQPGGAGPNPAPPAFFDVGLPLQRAGADAGDAWTADRDEPGLLARVGAGAGARKRRHQRIPRRRRLRQAAGQKRRRHAGAADRRAPERRVRPHPRLALLRRPGRRLRDRRLRQLERLHRRDARAAAAVRDLRPEVRRSRARAGARRCCCTRSRPTTTSSPGRKQPVASSRRAAPARSSSRPPGAGPTAGTTTTPAPTPSKCGPTSPRHYHLNPSFTDIAGYSMGGYGTYKFASQFPDLFARAQPTVGPPGLGVWVPPGEPQPGGNQSLTERMLGSVRNVPFLIWDETDRRARADRGRARTGQSVRRTRLPLRVRPVPGGRAPDARAQRRIRAGRRLPRDAKRSTATRRT